MEGHGDHLDHFALMEVMDYANKSCEDGDNFCEDGDFCEGGDMMSYDLVHGHWWY